MQIVPCDPPRESRNRLPLVAVDDGETYGLELVDLFGIRAIRPMHLADGTFVSADCAADGEFFAAAEAWAFTSPGAYSGKAKIVIPGADTVPALTYFEISERNQTYCGVLAGLAIAAIDRPVLSGIARQASDRLGESAALMRLLCEELGGRVVAEVRAK